MTRVTVKNETKFGDNDQLAIKIIDAALSGYRADLVFSDKSTLSLPVDIKAALSARIASLANPDHPWPSLQDHALYAIDYTPRDTGFVRAGSWVSTPPSATACLCTRAARAPDVALPLSTARSVLSWNIAIPSRPLGFKDGGVL